MEFCTMKAVKRATAGALCMLAISMSWSSFAQEKVVPKNQSNVMLSYAPLVKKAAPAVVNIYTQKKVRYRTFSLFDDPVFKHFFGGQLPGGGIKERVESSLGSGIIVNSNGLIITNNHVVSGSDSVKVVLNDRREFNAKVIITDEKTDLALLQIDSEGEKLPYLEFANSDSLEVGDLVLAIGNPFGVGQTVTSGIVSAVARTTLGITDYQFFIQTDAAINPGNSGGALINLDGKVVGINTAIFSRSGGSNGIGFAIPSNMAQTIITSGATGKKISRPWLGASIQPVTQEIATSLGLKRPVGALVQKIYNDGPLDKAGVKVGDIIVALDNYEINDVQTLHFRLATYKIGAEANIKIFRKHKEIQFPFEMQAPVEIPKRDIRKISGNNPFSGITVANLSPALANELGMDIFQKGVVVLSAESGYITNLGLRKNDIVAEINSEKITSTKQLERLVRKTVRRWQIKILRGGRVLNITWGR